MKRNGTESLDVIPDSNFEADGTPKWFDFIVSGGEPEYKLDLETGRMGYFPSTSGVGVTFEWPISQLLRIKCYARMAARGDEFDELG